MLLHFDLDLGKLVRKPGLGELASYLELTRGDSATVMVDFSRSGVAVAIGTPSEMVFVAKAGPGPGEAPLLLANAWTYDALADRWQATLATDTEALNALVGSAESVRALGELSFTTDTLGGPLSSQPLALRIFNDVWKGTEGTPLELPTPDAWLTARALRIDGAEQDLSEEQLAALQTRLGITPDGGVGGIPAPSAAYLQPFHIAWRTDGVAGTGTVEDPYDGSTQAKLDALAADRNKLPHGATIHIGSGVYETGCVQWPDSSKIHGAGRGETRVLVAELLPTPGESAAFFIAGPDATVTSLTVDCNWQNLAVANKKVGAVSLFGAGGRIRSVDCENPGGDLTNGHESFPLIVHKYGYSASVEVIEDCNIINARPGFDGSAPYVSGPTIAGQFYGELPSDPPYPPPSLLSVIEKCSVIGTLGGDGLPAISGQAAFGMSNGMSVEIRNCHAKNCTALVYSDTWHSGHIHVHDCVSDDNTFGVLIAGSEDHCSVQSLSVERVRFIVNGQGAARNAHGATVKAQYCGDVLIADCRSESSTPGTFMDDAGVFVQAAKTVRLRNNVFTDDIGFNNCPMEASESIVIEGNRRDTGELITVWDGVVRNNPADPKLFGYLSVSGAKDSTGADITFPAMFRSTFSSGRQVFLGSNAAGTYRVEFDVASWKASCVLVGDDHTYSWRLQSFGMEPPRTPYLPQDDANGTLYVDGYQIEHGTEFETFLTTKEQWLTEASKTQARTNIGAEVAGAAAAVTPTTLGLAIGTNVQAYNANLTGWAGKTAFAGALTITTAKTFDVQNSITLTGTDGVSINLGSVNGTLGSAAFTASTDYTPATIHSATPPESPLVGQKWFDTDDGSTSEWDGTSWVNTVVPAVLVGPGTPLPKAHAYKSSLQNGMTQNAWNLITFDTEVYDTDDCFSSSSFTAPYDCYVLVNFSTIPQNGTQTDQIALFVNGAVFRTLLAQVMVYTVMYAATCTIKCAAGDVLDLRMYPTGAYRALNGGRDSTHVTYSVLP